MLNLQLSLSFVFLQGLLSFFSPCVLPLVPAYLSMLAGGALPNALEKSDRWALLKNALCFITGFTLLFLAMGATATALGTFLVRNARTLRLVCGALIALMGLFMTGWIRLSFLEKERRPGFRGSQTIRGPLSAFLMGGAFGLGWTPCVGPALASVLMLAAGTNTLWRGMGLLFVYSMGLAVPFLLAAVFFQTLLPRLRSLNRYTPLIRKIAGVLLMLLGVMMMLGWLNLLASLA